MIDKTYRIAELFLRLVDVDAELFPELMDFAEEKQDGEPCVEVRFVRAAPPLVEADNALVKAKEMSVFRVEEGYYLQYHIPGTVKGCLVRTDSELAEVYVENGPIDGAVGLQVIRNAFFFYLQRRGKTVIHSASIFYKGKVWLFSAPSGVGKSSHVQFWREAGFSFNDFNGDLAICYLDENGKPVAAGSPWCGTSGIYCNSTASLGGVVFLQRGEENRIMKLNRSESVWRLVARSLIPNWTQEDVAKSVGIAEQLASKIEVALMTCTYDVHAAYVARGYINQVVE